MSYLDGAIEAVGDVHHGETRVLRKERSVLAALERIVENVNSIIWTREQEKSQ